MAGIAFKAYSATRLKEEVERHSQVRGNGLVRGSTKEQFAYGKMIPRGKRLPAGGARGDTYRYYEDQQADNTADSAERLQVLFNHAHVSSNYNLSKHH